MNYLDRNEFNYAPSQEVVEALKNFAEFNLQMQQNSD